MDETCNFFATLTGGISSIFNYNNIAISVLFAMVIFLLVWINKILNNQLVRDNTMRDALNDVKITMAVLNERLSHREDEEPTPHVSDH